MERTALHLPLGDRTATNLVDRWLDAYGIRTIVARDAYEVCAVLLRDSAPSCDIVFIGMDWLEDSERRIFGYVTQTWPDAVVVAYGEGSEDQSCENAASVISVSNNQSLFALLMESPETLLPRAEKGWRPALRGGGAEGGVATRRRTPRAHADASSVAMPTVIDHRGPSRVRARMLPREWTQLLDDNES